MTAHGVTLTMLSLARRMGERDPQPRDPRPRDRSLRGKARIKARRTTPQHPHTQQARRLS